MQNQDEVDLRWIFSIVYRWWWLILGCTVLAGGIVFGVVSKMAPTYEATATLMVSLGQDSRSNEYNTLVAGERLALTYIEMLKSQTILDNVINQLGLSISAETLAKNIQADTVKDTQLIRLTVKDTSPAQAELLTNTIAETFTAHIRKLQVERYDSLLAELQKDLDQLTGEIEAVQAQIDTLNANKIKDEARATDLEMLLTEQRNDYRSLERDYEDLKLTLSQLTNVVQVVEPAQASAKNADYPYQATTTLLVSNASPSGNVQANEQLIETYTEMLVGRPVLEATIARLGLNEDIESLLTKISVSPIRNTQLIRLNVVDSDTTKAALIANTIAEIFITNVKTILEEPYTGRLGTMQAQLTDLSAQMKDTQVEIAALATSNGQIDTELARQKTLLADRRSDYQALKDDYDQLSLVAADAAEAVSITEPAQVPEKPAGRSSLVYIIIAALGGAILTTGFVFLLEYLNDTIRTVEDVNRLLGLPALGTIGRMPRGDKSPVIIKQPLSPNAEAFRIIAANLRYSSLESPIHTLLVTSPNAQEGKSIVASNLAAALAMAELQVMVVDADLRRPNLHHIFGLEQSDGLTNSLLERSADGRLKKVDLERLWVLTSGDPPPNPAEVLGSSRMYELLMELRQRSDIVLVDSPPVLPVADTTLLAPHLDGVLIVLRANRTRSRAAIETVESLRKVGARIVGVVLNATPRTKKDYYSYYEPRVREEKERSHPQKSLTNALITLQEKIVRKV